MSWPYWAPKSKIRMRSFSGNGVMLVYSFLSVRFFVGPQHKERFQDRFVVNDSVTTIALDVDGAVFEELNLPILPRGKGEDQDGIFTRALHPVIDFGLIEASEQSQESAELVRVHLLYLSRLRSF